MASWKTTLGGVLLAVGTFLLGVSEWHVLGGCLAAAGSALLGAYARDNNVTSKQAGAE